MAARKYTEQDVLNAVFDDTNNVLKTNTSVSADIELGAVEIKDGGTDTRLTVLADNAAASTPNAAAVGGQYNSSAPTYTSGDLAVVQVDVNGNTKAVEQYAPGAEVNTGTGHFRVRQPCNFTNLSADTAVLSGTGWFYGFVCNSTTAGTVKIYDNTAGSGTVILNTFTPLASTVYILPATIVGTGIYFDITNTIDLTALYAAT